MYAICARICIYGYIYVCIYIYLISTYLYIYIYIWSKVNIWNVNCTRQQHSFSTHERVFFWKCQSFWDRKCLDLRGDRTSNLRIHAECSNLLCYHGQTFAVHVCEYWLWRYRYFWSKVNIRNVNCARATAFIFDTRTGVLVKVSKSYIYMYIYICFCNGVG